VSSDAVPDARSGRRFEAGELAKLARSFESERPESILRWAFEQFGSEQFALVSSFQAEAMVLIDMATRIQPDVRIMTIDTGRLPETTQELIDRVRDRYGVRVEILYPETRLVEAMTTQHGVNLFYREADLRKLCCHVRKVLPLGRALQSVAAWGTGLRRSQATTRANTPKVSLDENNGGIVKVCPLADWSWDDVWQYIRTHNVPHHLLYDQGYASIGCAPCTRPTQEGEDARSGRWWWEEATTHKECGLHLAGVKGSIDREVKTLMAGGEA